MELSIKGVVVGLMAGVATAAELPPSPVIGAADVRGVVLTFGEVAGVRDDSTVVIADDFKRCLPLLLEEKVNVVAVRFRPGVVKESEMQAISDVFANEYATKFRVVAWIEEALGDSGLTAHGFEEIYFAPNGVHGACTMYRSGRLVNPRTRDVESRLEFARSISARGGHDPLLMQAMMISSEKSECEALGLTSTGALSVTVDDRGYPSFYNDTTTGKIVLNPSKDARILILDAERALEIKFSRGTAETLDQLNDKLGMKVVWVGEKDPKSAWPVSKAERSLRDVHARLTEASKSVVSLFDTLTAYLRRLAGASPEQAAAIRSEARGKLLELRELIDREPRAIDLPFGGDRASVDVQLSNLAKALGVTLDEPKASPTEAK